MIIIIVFSHMNFTEAIDFLLLLLLFVHLFSLKFIFSIELVGVSRKK